jgi:hypothetical protein
MRARGILGLVMLVGLTAAAPAPAQSQDAIQTSFEQFTLPNGLQVILSPNRTVPEIAVATGTFYLIITPTPGHSLDELAVAADSVIARFKRADRQQTRWPGRRHSRRSNSSSHSNPTAARPRHSATASSSTATHVASSAITRPSRASLPLT